MGVFKKQGERLAARKKDSDALNSTLKEVERLVEDLLDTDKYKVTAQYHGVYAYKPSMGLTRISVIIRNKEDYCWQYEIGELSEQQITTIIERQFGNKR